MPYKNLLNATTPVIDTPFFVTNMLQLDGTIAKDYSDLDSFVILLCAKGNFSLEWDFGSVFVDVGECVLIPNVINKVKIKTDNYCKLLEVYIRENEY